MRTYDACLQELHSRPRYSKKLDLGRITALMQRLGDPQNALRFVHVAGTNGKGSVSAMTASVLQTSGARVGLYTSPFLKVFEERIRVNGENLPPAELPRIYETVLAAQSALEQEGGEPCNEFEFTTAMGFLWFREQRCDWVVLETGLGGRLDATNVIGPQKCCCITTIGLDHTAQLGGTLGEIAREKAGIIKPGCTVVTPHDQAPEALRVLREVCAARGAVLHVTKKPVLKALEPERTSFLYGGQPFSVPLAGAHQAGNAACAVELCRLLGLPEETIRRGLEQTVWPGRLQRLSARPCVVLDCGHNPNGIAALRQAMDTLYPGRPRTVLMAMMQDKDYAACVREIAAGAAHVVATTLPMPRALPANQLAACAAEVCPDVTAASDLREAVQLSLRKMEPEGLVLICGSVYLAGEILRMQESAQLF